MTDLFEPANIDPVERERLRHAAVAAYGAMYAAARPTIGTGTALIDGALAMWSPDDDGLDYNNMLGFELAPDPERAWEDGVTAAHAGGAHLFGIGIIPERESWATPARVNALGLVEMSAELVWAQRLDATPEMPLPAGTEIITHNIDPLLFTRLLNRGWEKPEDHPRGRLYAATLGLPNWIHYLALVDGRPAGVAALCWHDGVALLMVVTVNPAFRGRGLQTTFITRRLADAVAAGCDLATSETGSDNASPRNLHRAGFRFVHRNRLYGKALGVGR